MGRRTLALGSAALLALLPAVAFAHGGAEPRPGLSTLIDGWELDPVAILGLGATWLLYWWGVKHVARAHPKSPIPRRRVVYFTTGVVVLALALVSPLAAYDTTLFSAHMWQHMLITLVAAPLLALGAPITLALRAASPGLRREVLLPALHSRIVSALSFPAVAWIAFAATMWVSHFTPIFNASLEHEWLHRLEHLWYLGAGLLFWWPVVAVDPVSWRMSHPVRMLYLFLQMPQNSFLALAIYSSSNVIYSHYETLGRTWGPSPLRDQELAGISMWVVGDLLFLVAVICAAYAWLQHEELEAKRQDRIIARQRAAAAGTSAHHTP
jgi:putative copper resistance protein D